MGVTTKVVDGGVVTLDDVTEVVQSLIDENGQIQERTVRAMLEFAEAMLEGPTIAEASRRSGVKEGRIAAIRSRHADYNDLIRAIVKTHQRARTARIREATLDRKEGSDLVLRRGGERADRGSLTDFRMRYFGRPTPPHQELMVEALEDRSNQYVFILGPTGMGKDTSASDYLAWEICPDQKGIRGAWFMEAGDMSERRFSRLGRYLTDPTIYDYAPEKTPGGRKPEGSLITDYGPFRWRPGMVHPDGSPVDRPKWTSNEMYFVNVVAPEQDPNLWATGVKGATYGSRIDFCVCSDIFTLENQESPTERARQLSWVKRTLDTRLDETGRLVVIGTMLPVENNYELMIADYTAGARVIHTETRSHATYTKYSNGTAVVIIKAVVADPNSGVEVSYWPERAPLEDYLMLGDEIRLESELGDEEMHEMGRRGADRIRGLWGRRTRDPVGFKALFQQERDKGAQYGDFTAEVVDRTRNPDRSFGQAFPHELILVGVDPARRYGAAWAALAIDRREGVITLCDYFWGERLGVTGIKTRLVAEPLMKWDPLWFCYEDNKEAAILDDAEISELIRATGVSVDRHHTGRNRRSVEDGPGAIAGWMRRGTFQIPYRSSEDRARFEFCKSQFLAWDISTDRKRPGQAGHDPDDLVMAVWPAFLRARVMLAKGSKGTPRGIPVPAGIRAKFDRMAKRATADAAERARPQHHSADELIEAFYADE